MFPLDLKPQDVCIDDIVVAGSNICRFGGHLSKVYSINEHQLLCLDIVKTLSKDPRDWFAALTHDLCEVYSPIGDCLKPCKDLFYVLYQGKICSINEYEDNIQQIIKEALIGSTPIDYNAAHVKQADKIALNTESLRLRGFPIHHKYLVFNNFKRVDKVAKTYHRALVDIIKMLGGEIMPEQRNRNLLADLFYPY